MSTTQGGRKAERGRHYVDLATHAATALGCVSRHGRLGAAGGERPVMARFARARATHHGGHLAARALPQAVRPTRYLQPGHVLACAEPTVVTTILGSCVAVCVFDRERAIGAVNHFVFPHWTERRERSPRFGPIAVAQLLDRARALGGHALEAKLFGGAFILNGSRSREHVGAQNVRVARDELARAGVPIVAEDVGGGSGRKLVFHTDTGLALVKKL